MANFEAGDRVKYVGNTRGRYMAHSMVGKTGIVRSAPHQEDIDVAWDGDAVKGTVFGFNLTLLEPAAPEGPFYIFDMLNAGTAKSLDEAEKVARQQAEAFPGSTFVVVTPNKAFRSSGVQEVALG